MGMLSRIIRIWKADVNGVMDEIEDKELLLKQHLREMEAELQSKQSRHTSLLTEHRRLRPELEQIKAHHTELEGDLKIALHKNKDDIARMLIKKLHCSEQAKQRMSKRMEALQQEMETVGNILAKQKKQYEELSKKAADYLFDKKKREREAELPSDFPGHYQAMNDEPSEEEIELELIKYKERFQAEEQGAPS